MSAMAPNNRTLFTMNKPLVILLTLLSPALLAAQPQPLSPAESARSFQLPPGYKLELVVSEPEIKEPVVCAFDGNGRMFVAEMRTYMQDIDGKDELTPNSCVSLHWSSKGDGVYDKHTVFADKLLLPRMILPLDAGRLVICETNTNDLYLYTDTNGDGVSDKKELWWSGGPRGGNLEHQPSGLIWAIDNGIYSTYNAFRLRWTPDGVVQEPTANNLGQWGLGQDDHGKLFFSNAGGERGPQSYQIPIVYGVLQPKGQFAPGFEVVWPLVGLADVQGGKSRFRPEDGTLNHFTGVAGIEIYRGDRLPAELRGDLFFGEPVGRLVRRAKVTTKDGLTTLTNPHQEQKSEFLRSSDPFFRPVNMTTAPDGTLYLVDMYRGIIQEGGWVNKGSYLRKVVEEQGLDKVAGRGRIWRLVHETTKRGPQPAMLGQKPAELVADLAHSNGWWRDTAQKLLILKQDKSVAPALIAMARTHPSYLARLHALWTLQGLDALTPALVREKLKDEHPQVRAGAIRVSETLFGKGDTSLSADIAALAKDKDAIVAGQVFLTASLLKWPNAKPLADTAIANTAADGLKKIAAAVFAPPAVAQNGTAALKPEEEKLFKAGGEIFNSLCATCHGADAKGLPMAGGLPGVQLAPALAGSKTVTGPANASIFVLLHGLTGDIDGKKYEGQMIAMATNDDRWIASVLSYVRNSFGNHASFIAPEEVGKLRAATKSRTQPWTIAELHATAPAATTAVNGAAGLDRNGWKVSASHRNQTAKDAIDGNPATRYFSGGSQVPGMWFQVELLQPAVISGLVLDNTLAPRDYPRGYTVQLSGDGKTWGEPVATGKGSGLRTDIKFPNAPAKFIRINQTGSEPNVYWSINELQVIAAPAAAR